MQGRIQGAPLPKIGKNMLLWRKIVIFLHEIPQKFSRLPPLGVIFLSAPPYLEILDPPLQWVDQGPVTPLIWERMGRGLCFPLSQILKLNDSVLFYIL